MRYKVACSYDGSKFIGWQKQITGLSVQEDIERVLTIMHKRKVGIVGSGRTDRGVHAINQVFHFDSDLNIALDMYLHALNVQTNSAIYMKSIERVDDDFHARNHVKQKIYEYVINLGEYNVFMKDYQLQLNHELNIDKMKEASSYFIGTHDFASFNCNSFKEVPNQVRTIFDIKFTIENNLLRVEYSGSGFLRYMIRMLTQALIEVGKETMEPQDVKRILDAKDKELVSLKAKPVGLYLKEVYY